ncbi:universal stress protein [Chrysiogenes arsenatis]|uniref:universal stress protein n=1 Tax=Chrysiogenes arsenatis TaxID=309797 RepID=UPI00040922F0|nr:universal stress protein [Chrysiogenes arsenatis]
MLDFKKILLPVDMSDFSLQVAEEAVNFAEKVGAQEIIILSVVNVVNYSQSYINAIDFDQMNSTIQRHFSKELDKLTESLKGKKIPVRSLILEGNPYAEIVDYAEKNDVDLIIIGSHGYTGIDRFLLGSVAERVVRKAKCPVLTVRMKG